MRVRRGSRRRARECLRATACVHCDVAGCSVYDCETCVACGGTHVHDPERVVWMWT